MEINRERAWPDVAVPPGELLAETLAGVGMPQADLARRMGRPAQAVNEIIQGRKEITPETAIQLEHVLGTPAHVWIGLEADYRFLRARLRERAALGEEAETARRFPYAEMARHDWVPDAKSIADKARALLDFFGVASLSKVEQTEAIAWRRSRVSNGGAPYALAAWLRRGEIEARQEIEARRGALPSYSDARLHESLPTLRALTREASFADALRERLSECGVVAVFVKELRGAGANGATRWLFDRPIVQLCIRHRWSDVFWFTVFHEIAHVLLHPRATFVEYVDRTGSRDDHDLAWREEEANRFASETLLPKSVLEPFVAAHRGRFSSQAVERFAERSGVSPAIVVGRLHHDGHLPRTHLNGLRPRLEWRD